MFVFWCSTTFVWTNFSNFLLQHTYAWRNCNFFNRDSTPYFEKRSCSRIFLVLLYSGKYYAKQPLLKVNWADFWKFIVSRGNFQKWFISEPPRFPPKLPTRINPRSKNLCILVLYNFYFNNFFVSAFFNNKWFSKN